MQGFEIFVFLALSYTCSIHAFLVHRHGTSVTNRENVIVAMGLFDFFKARDGDFVKLETTTVVGPGPLILMYNIPNGIMDDEIRDMILDGAPEASKQGEVCTKRLYPMDLKDPKMRDLTVEQVLAQVLEEKNEEATGLVEPDTSPILYFSAISNEEMMRTYNIIAREIYEESNGTMPTACAKVVEAAMQKNFRQLIEEISSDHAEALSSSES